MEENKVKESKIKNHFKKHKVKYLVGGTAVGGIGLGAYLGNKGIINLQLVNTGKVEQYVDNSINYLSRRGHAGNIIRCKETGETFASQRRASELLGISPHSISSNLKGKVDKVKGMSFEKVGDFHSQE